MEEEEEAAILVVAWMDKTPLHSFILLATRSDL
jgi:hypothetical protein